MNVEKNIKNNIVLCGFMGSGKTTVGKQLSQQIGLNFIDTDNYIENATGLTVSKIFEIYGEKFFRKLEQDCIKVISNLNPVIISTGGGSILEPNNIYNLKKNGKIFFLNANINSIISRLTYDLINQRPLIKNKNSIKELFLVRQDDYFKAADFIIDANNDIETVCKNIIDKITFLQR